MGAQNMSPMYHQQQQQQQQRYMGQQGMNQPPPQAMNQNQLYGQQGGQQRFWHQQGMQQNPMNPMGQQNSDMLFNNSQQMQPEMAPHDQLNKFCENL